MKKPLPYVIENSDSKLVALASLYDMIFGEELSAGRRIYIGDQASEFRQCRFCGKTSSETSFRNVAHAIPESLGNKRLISLEECDECNTYFSKELEDSLDKYLQPYRTLFFIKGKKRPPSYKTDDKTARIDPVDGQLRVSGEEEKVFLKKHNGDLEMFLHRQPYRPLSVFKALVKIALSILPREEDVEALTPVKRWIRSPDIGPHFPGPHIASERLPSGRGRTVKGSTLYAMIYRRKPGADKRCPYLVLLLSIGGLTFELGIPLENEVVNFIPLFPIPSETKYGKTTGRRVDFTSNEWVKGARLKASFTTVR